MENPYVKNLGKVRPTAEGEHNINKEYDILSIVNLGSTSYISKKPVPTGINITNEEFWTIFCKGFESEGNPPDEEDLTLVNIDGLKKMQFKDKNYDSISYSGFGRCYLRKNMIDGVNVLTQDMFANADGSPKENTRYIIQYDYDLNGETLEIPKGCVLDFQGGGFSNGYLNLGANIIIRNGIFNDVIISSSLNNIEFKNCDFRGGRINNSGTSYENGLLSFNGSNDILISCCAFHDGRLGLYCSGVSNIKVVDTNFERISYWPNYFSSVKGLLFNGCYCAHNGEDGIKLTGEIGDVIISDNESCYNGQDGFDFAGHSCYNVSIVNNNFHDNDITGITFKSLDKDLYPIDRWNLVDSELKWININISNNNLNNNKISGITSYHYYAGEMGERFRNVVISNNLILSNVNSNTGMHISANTSIYHSVVISNNIIKGDFKFGTTLSNARYFMFKNNEIYVDNIGLRIDKQNYNGEPWLNDIINNTIQSYRDYALTLYEEAKYNNVKNNHIRSSKKDAINDLGDNNVAFNYRLDMKTKNTMYSSLTDLTKADYLYNAFNSDNGKAEYWNGTEWLNYDGTLKNKVKFI